MKGPEMSPAIDPMTFVVETLKELKEGIEKLDHAIRGNGTPGLNTRVAQLERDLARSQKVAAAIFALGAPIALDWLRRQLGI